MNCIQLTFCWFFSFPECKPAFRCNEWKFSHATLAPQSDSALNQNAFNPRLFSVCVWGSSPVPLEPFLVVAVEEVRLCAHGADVRMQAQELEERARAALLHADDDGLGQLLGLGAVEGPALLPLVHSGDTAAAARLPWVTVHELRGERVEAGGLSGVRGQAGHAGAVADAAVQRVGPQKQHDAQHQKFVSYRGQRGGVRRVAQQTIFHMTTGAAAARGARAWRQTCTQPRSRTTSNPRTTTEKTQDWRQMSKALRFTRKAWEMWKERWCDPGVAPANSAPCVLIG